MPLSWVAVGVGNMELFYVHWNVSMETGLVTVTDEVIKPRSNRNPNQSLNQRLSPAVPSVCNQPGNRFTWNCFVDTGKLRCAAFYKAWWISEKIVFASLTGNLTLRMGSYDFFFFFSVWSSTLWDRVYLNFSEEEIKIKRSFLFQERGHYTSQSKFKPISFSTKAHTFNQFYSLCSSLTEWSWD